MVQLKELLTIGLLLCFAQGCATSEHKLNQMSRQWILIWNDGDPEELPLADDFQHTSPYGHLEGRRLYLDTVVPMAKQNAATLTVEDVLVSGTQSVVRYTVANPSGDTMRACDWLTFRNGQLVRVRSYYERPEEGRKGSY